MSLITHTLNPVLRYLASQRKGACLPSAHYPARVCGCVCVRAHLWVCSWRCVTPPSSSLILSGTDSWHVCRVRTNNSFQVFDQSSTTNISIPQADFYTHTLGHPVEPTEWCCVLITTQTAWVNKKMLVQFSSWRSEGWTLSAVVLFTETLVSHSIHFYASAWPKCLVCVE